jgi:hypothetical protein
VKFREEGGGGLPPIEETSETSLSDDRYEVTLCESLKSYLGPVTICLHATPTSLYCLPNWDVEPEDTEIMHEDGNSLATLLTGGYEISDEGKLFLASRLAFAVWQYYNSKWMACRWTAHAIQFLREHRLGDTDQLPLKPYVEMDFEETDAPMLRSKPSTGFGMLHPDPKILALGVALAVIFWGPLPSWTAEMSEMHRYNREIVECNLKTKRDLQLSMNSVFPIEENIRGVVEACLNHREVKALHGDERRGYLLQKVVSPLERVISALKVSGFKSSSESWRRADHHRAAGDAGKNSTTGPGYTHPPTPTIGRYVAPTLWYHDFVLVNTLCSDGSKAWINSIPCSTLSRDVGKLYRGKKKEGRSRVKLAILDTGYAPERLDKQTNLERVHWKDFVADSAHPCDASIDSHGSTMLQLVKRLAPDAEIFVVRIARSSDELHDINPIAGGPICNVRGLPSILKLPSMAN